MLDVIGNNVETNLTTGNMLTMATKYIGAKDNVVRHQLEGSGEKIDGVYYWIPDQTNLQEVIAQLKVELDKNAKEPPANSNTDTATQEKQE